MMYYMVLAGNLLATAMGIYAIINWIKLKKSLKQIFELLGFIPFNFVELTWGLLIGFFVITILFTILLSFGTINFISVGFNFSSFREVFFTLLILVIIEEIIFRSLFINGLKQFTSNEYYIILFSAMIFAIVHFANPGITVLSIISASLGGIMYTYAFLLTNQLWTPIGIHFSWNFIQGYFYGLPLSGFKMSSLIKIDVVGPQSITGGEYGPEGSIPGIFSRLLLILLLYFIDKLIYKNEKVNSLSIS